MESEHQGLVDSLVKEYARIDGLAAGILEDRRQIVELDNRRNKTREALRQIKGSHSGQEQDSKTWLCVGNTFLKVESHICEAMLNKDSDTLQDEITRLRDGLKPKVNKLHKMEGVAEVKGFELKGMKIEDILNIKTSAEP